MKQRQHMDGISSASHSHVNSPNTTPAHINNHIMQASASEDETLQSGNLSVLSSSLALCLSLKSISYLN